MNYQQQTIAGMNPVELVVALYDGMVRFLYKAIDAIEHGRARERRVAVGRVLQILMHLQSRLRTDVGGNSAKALSEFYASIFALCIEGSRLQSADRLKEAIGCVRDVRDAWNVAAHDPDVLRTLAGERVPAQMTMPAQVLSPEDSGSSWTA
jgi:flagellar protein FliS